MSSGLSQRLFVTSALSVVLLFASGVTSRAQTDDLFGDSGADPIKLFERGQSAHARGDLEKALAFYEQALRVRPEFPEAEFQKAIALVSLTRFPEAEAAFRRAIALKKQWALPYSSLGALLMRQQRDTEAEPLFRQALALDAQDNLALRLLSEIKLRGGNPREALELARKATQDKEAPASSWIVLALAERANGNKSAAKEILDRLIADAPNNVAALIERADLLTEEKSYEAAIGDLKAADTARPNDKIILSRLAFVYQQAGRFAEADAVAKAAGLEVQAPAGNGKLRVIGTPEEIDAANSDDPLKSRAALEKLIEKNPRNPVLLARLGASYRTDAPTKSLELYRRATEIQPESAEFAIGYAAALVQARRFPEAAGILRQVLKSSPENYAARANFATALYEMKQYADAIQEYQWIINARPDAVVAHYFIATSHDYLREYVQALAAYEKFLATADAKTNQLEIDKVRLRLPSLRRQIQLGEGVKKKP
jgi:tetratricopeptide (TPR) repeat protein